MQSRLMSFIHESMPARLWDRVPPVQIPASTETISIIHWPAHTSRQHADGMHHPSSEGLVKKTVITALLTVFVVSAFAQESGQTPHAATVNTSDSRAHVLTREELDKLLARPQNLLVIDVRRPDEVSKIGGLPVYLSIQLSDLQKSLAWIPKGRTIVTVSNHAKRAGTAADLLASKGFKVAGAAGVQTYEQEGGKLTKIVPPPPSNANAATARSP
jgi:rhodanese-related sulfurtransferase